LFVLMLGEPGSGKTCLGTQLAGTFRMPFLARDDVRTGLYVTAGAWTDRPGPAPAADDAVEAFLVLTETMARLGVSCVVEYVVRDRRPQDLNRLTLVANCVGLWTWCDDAPARLAVRDRANHLINRRPVLDALGFRTIEEHVASATSRMAVVTSEMRESFDFPLLRVETNDSYEPNPDKIIEFVASAGQ
jgi:predicted kinase